MKIKLLPILTGLFITTATMTSCLKSDTPDFEYVSDANIYVFNIDTIYGKTYNFSIDQANGLIFNQDSLPVASDTIINKILIKEISTRGASVSHNGEFIALTDSIDLTGPFELNTKSITGEHAKTYTVNVNVHKQDPNLLEWVTMDQEIPANFKDINKVTVSLGTSVFVYAENGDAYKLESHKAGSWNNITTSGIQVDENNKIKNVVKENDILFLLAGTKVYKSNDGVNWEGIATNLEIETLLAVRNGNPYAMTRSNGTLKFCYFDNQQNTWLEGENVPNNFVKENLSSAPFQGNHGQNTSSMLMGSGIVGATNLFAWTSNTGKTWTKLSDNINKAPCPLLDNPIMFRYNDMMYTLGKREVIVVVEDDKKKEENEKPEEVKKIVYRLFTSVDGINWQLAPSKEQLKEEVYDKVIESVTVDENNYIWFTCKDESKIWRGRLNHLGFDK